MSTTELLSAIRAAGISKAELGPFFGYSRMSGYRWLAGEGPPPAVAKFLRFMRAAKMTAADINETIGADHG